MLKQKLIERLGKAHESSSVAKIVKENINEINIDIDVVPDEFMWTVNWLHYLNY